MVAMTRERLALANEPRSRKGKEGYQKQPNFLIIKHLQQRAPPRGVSR
jgi:hypothetical protein